MIHSKIATNFFIYRKLQKEHIENTKFEKHYPKQTLAMPPAVVAADARIPLGMQSAMQPKSFLRIKIIGPST